MSGHPTHGVGGRGRRRASLVLALLFLATAGGGGCGAAAAPAAELPRSDVRRDAVVEAVARVMPSVVNISTETIVAVRDPFEEMLQEFWGPYYRRGPSNPRQYSQYSLGSGVIVDEAGYVLTNDHVVRRASRIRVRLAQEGGGKEYEARVVGESARSDLALLKIEGAEEEKFAAAPLAADDDLLLGETVVALGNPFGLGGSVSRGILSSKSRRPPVENAPLGLEDWLQTDAAINPGNSGGPLINLRGEMIGMSVAVHRGGQGIGFAIPVKRVTEALLEISSPEMKDLWFGARVRPAAHGLVVSAVEPGSPADQGGLRPGDRVREVGDRTPRGWIEFIRELSRAGAGTEVRFRVQRDGGTKDLTVRLVQLSSVFNAGLVRQKLGLSVQEITPDLVERMGLLTDRGLLVAGVDRNGPAAAAGIQRGHIVLGLEGQVPEDVVAAARSLQGKKTGDKVTLEVLTARRRGFVIYPERWEVEVTVP